MLPNRRRELEARRLHQAAGAPQDLTPAQALLDWCGGLAHVRDLNRTGDVPDPVLVMCVLLATGHLSH